MNKPSLCPNCHQLWPLQAGIDALVNSLRGRHDRCVYEARDGKTFCVTHGGIETTREIVEAAIANGTLREQFPDTPNSKAWRLA